MVTKHKIRNIYLTLVIFILDILIWISRKLNI